MHLSTELTATGGNTTGIRVPAEVVAELGGGSRPKVVATVNGHTWRSSIAPYNGEYWLGVSAANRAAAGIAAGDSVELDIELDTAPRTVEVPDDLASPLHASPAAKAAWDALSYSHQRQHIEAVAGAKTPETRVRRIAAVIAKLQP